MFLRFMTLALLVIVPVYKVNALKERLRSFRKDGQSPTFPPRLDRLFEEYKPETYVPEARELVEQLVGWSYVQAGAILLTVVGFIVWGLIDPILP
jgi:hypothetical protein